MIFLFPDEFYTDKSRQCSGNAGNTQIDKNAFGNLPDTYLDDTAGKSEIGRQDCNKKPGKSAVKKNLKNTVESNQTCWLTRVASVPAEYAWQRSLKKCLANASAICERQEL